MTIDDELVRKVDAIAKELHTTRSAFTRDVLWKAVNDHTIHRLELKHRRGYETHPERKEEFSVWEEEQNWGDE
jgi:predicted transcriptional regulator